MYGKEHPLSHRIKHTLVHVYVLVTWRLICFAQICNLSWKIITLKCSHSVFTIYSKNINSLYMDNVFTQNCVFTMYSECIDNVFPVYVFTVCLSIGYGFSIHLFVLNRWYFMFVLILCMCVCVCVSCKVGWGWLCWCCLNVLAIYRIWKSIVKQFVGIFKINVMSKRYLAYFHFPNNYICHPRDYSIHVSTCIFFTYQLSKLLPCSI